MGEGERGELEPEPDAPDAYEQCARLLDKLEESEGFDARAFLAEYPRHAERLRLLLRRLLDAGPDPRSSRPAHASRSASFVSAGSDVTATVLRRLLDRGSASERFEHEEEVARGGQGAILRVWDEDLGRHLAMKLAHESASSGSMKPEHSRSIGRFLEEARITAQLDHPGIVPVHDLGTDARGHVYFTMKLVKGRDLKEVFALVAKGEEGWSVPRALHVMLRVCEGMAYAHSKGVIHRDLKPGNVMVGRFGEVYVMDWGLARVLGQDDGRDIRIQPPMTTTQVHSLRHHSGASTEPDAPLLTMDGDVVGTPAYMSPEQANGDLAAMGPHSDVYSAGAMLYHLLAGHPPYVPPGVKLNNYAIWVRVQEGAPVPLHQRAPEAPAELLAICEKAMARESSKRYADMSGLAEDLRAYLEHRVVRAYETGAVAELKKWVVRNRAQALTAALAVVLVVAALVAALWVRTRERDKALESEQRALKSEAEARAATANVMRLSAFQDVEGLQRRADELWPAVPSRQVEYREWMAEARRLVAGLEPDPTTGDPGHLRVLAELRGRALPQSEAEHAAALAAHPRRAELAALEQRCAALRYALDVRAERSKPIVFPLDKNAEERAAEPLNEEAWKLVDPDRSQFGREAEGLALARCALARAGKGRLFVDVSDTLAWAYFANGLDEDALGASRDSVAFADPQWRPLAESYLAAIDGAVEARLQNGERDLALLEQRRSALEWELAGRRFESDDDRWWHDQLGILIDELTDLADRRVGLMGPGLSPRFGWGIERRLDFALALEERSRSGEEARSRWKEACDAIADPQRCPRYGGLRIAPQLGLLPLGCDRDSGLWEFAHLPSGAPAPREGEDLKVDVETGLVLVLIPGGTFQMGSQNEDPALPLYDLASRGDEQPPHDVEIEPFFLSKFEMTQSQWKNAAGSNPSNFSAATVGGDASTPSLLGAFRNPVESVSWDDSRAVLARLGLELPTEAQWEYAARAGTTTPWCLGSKDSDLIGTGLRVDRPGGQPDSLPVHGQVVETKPNAFGLHGIVGNVGEWCRDSYRADFHASSPFHEPVWEDPRQRERVARGGSYADPSWCTRSAFRFPMNHDYRGPQIGVRPMRRLER